jgi:hypothetical protein
MHNSIPEYVSSASILKPFEKKFLKKWFLLKYHQNPQVLKRWSKEKEREKKKQKREIEEEKKALRVSSNKGEFNILKAEKHFNFENPFQCDSIFSPSIIPFQKPFPKSLRKFFLTLFRPSFSLTIYMTWVVPFSFTQELHIPKRVLECLILRNHSIIFSLIDFKKEAK